MVKYLTGLTFRRARSVNRTIPSQKNNGSKRSDKAVANPPEVIPNRDIEISPYETITFRY